MIKNNGKTAMNRFLHHAAYRVGLFAALTAATLPLYAKPEKKTMTNDAKPQARAEIVAAIKPAVGQDREYDLHAGPVRAKFASGELRYLHVGDKEIARRIYFAVRDGDWDTAPPQFDHIKVTKQANGFTIDLTARCVLPAADYSWTAKIVGTPGGKITWTVSGSPNKDFKSNRIGLCVLYGAPSLADQPFEAVRVDGVPMPGMFPPLVSPSLVAKNYQTLRYKTTSGLSVDTTIAGQAKFDMEDQRTYSDSSYKAYAPFDYDYKLPVKQGERKEAVFTLSVSGVGEMAEAVQNGPYQVRVGKPIAGATVPQIEPATMEEIKAGGVFGAVNNQPQKSAGAKTLTWGYNPSTHLPDDDTFVENAVTILDQVKTAHSYAPDAKIRIAPLTFDNRHPRPNPRDERNTEAIGGLWTALMVKYLSLAGVQSAGFNVGGADGKSPADAVRKSVASLAGRPVLEATVSGGAPYPLPVEAFAVGSGTSRIDYFLYLMNTSAKTQTVRVPDDGSKRQLTVLDVATGKTQKVDGGATVNLAPYAVVKITPPSAHE